MPDYRSINDRPRLAAREGNGHGAIKLRITEPQVHVFLLDASCPEQEMTWIRGNTQ
jgi:hypothetical protein